MEQLNGKRAAHKKFSRGVASLAFMAAIVFFVGTAAVAPAHAQISQTSQTVVKILSPSEHDTFGYAVAVSGNTMVVGAQGGDGVIPPALPTAAGLTFDTGVAYIYERSSGNTWVQTAKLIANDGVGLNAPFLPNDPANSGSGKADLFGTSVAISGDTVIIGAPAHTHPGFQSQSGAVYVFQKINGTWTQQAELQSPTPSIEGNFGTDLTVGISNNTIVVGDVGGPTNFFTPGVDVFTRTNGVWQNTATLQVPDDFLFEPSSVAIDGNTVVVGSTNSDGAGVPFGGAGAAYVFALKNGQWTQQADARRNRSLIRWTVRLQRKRKEQRDCRRRDCTTGQHWVFRRGLCLYPRRRCLVRESEAPGQRFRGLRSVWQLGVCERRNRAGWCRSAFRGGRYWRWRRLCFYRRTRPMETSC